MLTRRIDAALDTVAACRNRLPPLRDLFRDGTCERAALDNLLEALERANDALLRQPQTLGAHENERETGCE